MVKLYKESYWVSPMGMPAVSSAFPITQKVLLFYNLNFNERL